MVEKETYLIKQVELMKDDQMAVCGTFADSNIVREKTIPKQQPMKSKVSDTRQSKITQSKLSLEGGEQEHDAQVPKNSMKKSKR